MSDQESAFPLEVVISGVPRSLQATNSSRLAWSTRVHDVALDRRNETYQLGLLDNRALSVTIYYFSPAPMDGDIDNIVKPIMDGLKGVAYVDDRTVERVVAQKFEPEATWEFADPTERLAVALDGDPPIVYIRVDDDLKWRQQDGSP